MKKKVFLFLPVLMMGLILAIPTAKAFSIADLQLDGPTILFPSEQAQWVASVSIYGMLASNTVLSQVCGQLYGNSTCAIAGIRQVFTAQLVNATNQAVVATLAAPSPVSGVAATYVLSYTVPANIRAGFYVLVLQYTTNITPPSNAPVMATAVRGFEISSTLEGFGATLTDINGTVTTINTNIGIVKVQTSAINATVMNIRGDTVQLKTNLGTMNTTLQDVRARIIAVNGQIVTFNSTVGTFAANINAIRANSDYLYSHWNSQVGSNTIHDLVMQGFNDANTNNLTSAILPLLDAIFIIAIFALVIYIAAFKKAKISVPQPPPIRAIVGSVQSGSPVSTVTPQSPPMVPSVPLGSKPPTETVSAEKTGAPPKKLNQVASSPNSEEWRSTAPSESVNVTSRIAWRIRRLSILWALPMLRRNLT